MKMRRTRSMECLDVLPEEAKMAASLLRLTLSDKQENVRDTEFQSYMRNNNQSFPYHRTVIIADVRPENKPTKNFDFGSFCPPVTSATGFSARQCPQTRRVLRRRCESSPSAIEDSKKTNGNSNNLSKSAPGESFFQRLFPSFLRRRSSKEADQEKEEPKKQPAPIVVTAAAQKNFQIFPEAKQFEKDNSGQYVRQFVRMEHKMDKLIFMSMR